MENSRRFMVQGWLNRTWEEQVRPLLVRPAHYSCWKCAQAGQAGLGSLIFWDKHCWASCCLLSDRVVNTKWWTSIKNAQETLGGVRNSHLTPWWRWMSNSRTVGHESGGRRCTGLFLSRLFWLRISLLLPRDHPLKALPLGITLLWVKQVTVFL